MKKIIQKIIPSLNRRYRVELIDDLTLSSSKQYSFRPLFWILGIVGLFLGIIIGTAATIWYTPAIRSKIPGYTNPQNERMLITMQSQIENLQKENKQKDAYISSVQTALSTGTAITPSTEVKEAATKEITSTEKNQAKIEEKEKEKISKSESEKKVVDNQKTQPILVQPTPGEPAIKQSTKISLGIKTVMRPVTGYIREGFSPSKGHYGIDVVTNENETVLAATEGFVQIAEYTETDGYMIVIASPKGVNTVYKHCSRLLKKKGSYVQACEPIAVVGNTGENSSGPHLHFEMWSNGEPLNPKDYVFGFKSK